MPGISMAGCVLLLATTLSAQYLERVIPVSDPPAGGAVSMPACRIYNSATNRVYALGDWLAVVDCSARKGDKGDVVDVDESAGLLFVDFGRGAIACSPEDVR